ncbi:hypothetical protein GOP47_0024502 [Adiantum capillus-veneris]|uniref:Uncharacterized protein n=1 Tax=Adiantum capillus-veneris TaxID=13818 RepID=A0A9D4Z4F6_ADICA|nr:hypothetical protein GOP47_0024502 [Adiantum capillus-veneris]
MEKMFGPAYAGDPGVPHSGKDGFANLFWGCVTFAAISWFNPYYWQYTNCYNWHDLAMVCENHRMKKAIKENKLYEPLWNEYMPKLVRDSYFQNWPDYFP